MSKGFHTRHRKDANHNEIFNALLGVTHCVDIHNYGKGMGDILARHTKTGVGIFLEVKSGPADKLTENELAFGLRFRNWQVVYTVEDALRVVGVDI